MRTVQDWDKLLRLDRVDIPPLLTLIAVLFLFCADFCAAGGSSEYGRTAGVNVPVDWVRGGTAIAPGSSKKLVTSESEGGFRRSFRLHLPVGYDPAEQYPLVVALHGGLATAKIFERQSNLSAVADRHGFVVVYPNGIGVFSLLRHWNGGYCCARAKRVSLDDSAFLDRVRGWIGERYSVDAQRHYVVGYSNGGMLAYWYGATRSDEIAGLGIWASSIVETQEVEPGDGAWQMPWPKRPVPAIIAHGKADPRLPYALASVKNDASGLERRKVLGALESARAWAGANGCVDIEPTKTQGSLGSFDVSVWCGADYRRKVRLLVIDGWNHDWPGPRFTQDLNPDDVLQGFDLGEEMWLFFEGIDAANGR